MQSVAAVILFWAPSLSHGQSKAEKYTLQERCGKRAEEIFRTEYGSHRTKTNNGELFIDYQSHYNERLNKCFFLENATSNQRIDGKPISSKLIRLFDANENKERGNFNFGICYVDEKTCSSYDEFMKLLRPYMEE